MFLNHTNPANLTTHLTNPMSPINLDLSNVNHLTISIACPSTVPSPEPADLTFTTDDFFSMANAFLAVFKGVLAAFFCAITFSAAFFVLAAVLLLLYQGFVCLWQLIVQKIQSSRSYRQLEPDEESLTCEKATEGSAYHSHETLDLGKG